MYTAIIATPIGKLGVRTTEEFLSGVDFLADKMELLAPTTPLAAKVSAQLSLYFWDPAHIFELPLLSGGTLFQQKIWQALSEIPAGHTRSYGDLAREFKTSPRAIGSACRTNPIPIVVPCHRVVAKQGLGGFMGAERGRSIAMKSWLLQYEAAKSST